MSKDVYDLEEMDSAELEELGLTREELEELASNIAREQFGVKEDTSFDFWFNNGLGMDIVYKTGIYHVDVWDDVGEVHVGSYFSFESMLKGIATICQNSFEDDYEKDTFIGALYRNCASFDEKIKVDMEDVWDLLEC